MVIHVPVRFLNLPEVHAHDFPSRKWPMRHIRVALCRKASQQRVSESAGVNQMCTTPRQDDGENSLVLFGDRHRCGYWIGRAGGGGLPLKIGLTRAKLW